MINISKVIFTAYCTLHTTIYFSYATINVFVFFPKIVNCSIYKC